MRKPFKQILFFVVVGIFLFYSSIDNFRQAIRPTSLKHTEAPLRIIGITDLHSDELNQDMDWSATSIAVKRNESYVTITSREISKMQIGVSSRLSQNLRTSCSLDYSRDGVKWQSVEMLNPTLLIEDGRFEMEINIESLRAFLSSSATFEARISFRDHTSSVPFLIDSECYNNNAKNNATDSQQTQSKETPL